jgi:Flp pilus assembly protein TadG
MQTDRIEGRRTNGKRSAQSLVEFCLCVPILLILLVGTADIGFLLWTEMTITEAVRSGAIFATALANSTANWNANTANETLVKNYIVNITNGTGLTASEITITPVTIGTIDALTITINHIHTYMAPISFNGLRAESTANTFPINRTFTCGFIGNMPPS